MSFVNWAPTLTHRQTFKFLAAIRRCCIGRKFKAFYSLEKKETFLYIYDSLYLFRIPTKLLNKEALSKYMKSVEWTLPNDDIEFNRFKEFHDHPSAFKSFSNHASLFFLTKLFKRMSRMKGVIREFSIYEKQKEFGTNSGFYAYYTFCDFAYALVMIKR